MTDPNHSSRDQMTTLIPAAEAPDAADRQPFVEPRLRFIEPKLTLRGDLRHVTAGFVADFSP